MRNIKGSAESCSADVIYVYVLGNIPETEKRIGHKAKPNALISKRVRDIQLIHAERHLGLYPTLFKDRRSAVIHIVSTL